VGRGNKRGHRRNLSSAISIDLETRGRTPQAARESRSKRARQRVAEVAPKGWLQLIVEPLGSTRRGLRVKFEEDGGTVSPRVRDLVPQLAFEGLSENEIGRARISMMARSDLLHARAGYRSARPVTATLQI
jgi:hypothetical protein